MRRVIILIGLIIAISCYSQTCNCQTKTDSIAFLRNIGTEILDGLKISKINEKDIYDLIHSVMVKDSNERAFYFKVFNKIRNQAGGYIAEDISFYARDYCRSYPNEFFCLTNVELKSYAYEIGELIRTEEEFPQKSAEDFIKEIKEKCYPKYWQKVDTFSKDIFDEMESRK
jgi:hypothetical protein